MAEITTAKYCTNCTLSLLQPTEVPKMHTDRVEELLHQNLPPLEVELSAFRKLAEDARGALEDLDSKIIRARELLDNLLSTRRQVQSRFDDAKSILHPMRSIPNELLAQIFDHCISKVYSVTEPDALDPHGAPWLFTRVCSRWRKLAVNSPQLWTYLLLDFDKHKGNATPRQVAYRAGLFTERSRGLPMTVYLGSENEVDHHPVLPCLEVSIPRWRYLQVDLPRESLQCLSRNYFSDLQTLYMQYNNQEWDLRVDVFQPTFAPVLRSLLVSYGYSWRAFDLVSLPWSHLTSVTLFPAFDIDALIHLRTMTNLEDLHVAASSDNHAPIGDAIPLPKLRRVSIHEDDNSSGRGAEFLSALTASPALSELILEFPDHSVTHFPTEPFPFSNLTKLDITCTMNSPGENTQHLLNFLSLTHRVEWLRLYDLKSMTAEFFDGLNLSKFTDGTPVRLPRLQFLHLGKNSYTPILGNSELVSLFAMLDSRLPDDKTPEVDDMGEPSPVHPSNEEDGHAQSGLRAGSSSKSCSNSQMFLEKVRLPRWVHRQMKQRDFVEPI